MVRASALAATPSISTREKFSGAGARLDLRRACALIGEQNNARSWPWAASSPRRFFKAKPIIINALRRDRGQRLMGSMQAGASPRASCVSRRFLLLRNF